MMNPYILTNYRTGLWSKDEVQRLISAVTINGSSNWKLISMIVGTRNDKQWQSKWKNIDGSGGQPTSWNAAEERHLFDLIFSNAYILLERNSGFQFKKDRKSVAIKIKEMRDIWERAYFQQDNRIVNPEVSINRDSPSLNSANLPSLNKKALKLNKKLNEQLDNDEDLQIIDSDEAYSNKNPIVQKAATHRKDEERKIQNTIPKMTKEMFIEEWKWTDGRIKWTTDENIKLIHLYQHVKESWVEIGNVFHDIKLSDIRNHFYAMLYLVANEYQSSMTISINQLRVGSQENDKWILNYTNGVKDSLYISDINKVSEEKLLCFLPILANIFNNVLSESIWNGNSTYISVVDGVEYRPLGNYGDKQNISEEESTISYLRNLMLGTNHNLTGLKKKPGIQIDLTEDEEQKEHNSEKSDEELINLLISEAAQETRIIESNERTNENLIEISSIQSNNTEVNSLSNNLEKAPLVLKKTI